MSRLLLRTHEVKILYIQRGGELRFSCLKLLGKCKGTISYGYMGVLTDNEGDIENPM